MKGLGRKVSFLAVAAVMATALLGAAYTLWYENLNLKATVTTGTLDVDWMVMKCNDTESSDWDTQDGFAAVAKDVASFARAPLPLPQDELTLTIENGYPGYAVDCELKFSNVGSVPVHVERELIDIDTDGDGSYEVHLVCTANVNEPVCTNLNYLTDPWPSTVNDAPLYVRLADHLGCQVHTGDLKADDLLIGVRQPAGENKTYRVKLTIQFNQWNESGWNGCANPRLDSQGNPLPVVTPPPGSGREN